MNLFFKDVSSEIHKLDPSRSRRAVEGVVQIALVEHEPSCGFVLRMTVSSQGCCHSIQARGQL